MDHVTHFAKISPCCETVVFAPNALGEQNSQTIAISIESKATSNDLKQIKSYPERHIPDDDEHNCSLKIARPLACQ